LPCFAGAFCHVYGDVLPQFATKFTNFAMTATTVGALPATPCNETPHILQYRGERVNVVAK
jgi:hypothetical protein